MPPVMRLTLRWEEGEEKSLHTTLKIKVPRTWKEGPTLKLKDLFVENYNQKHPNNPLDLSRVHLLNPNGEQLADDDILVRVLNPSDTVRVKPGSPPSLAQVEEARKHKKKGLGAKTVIDDLANDDSAEKHTHVNSAEALQKASEPKFAFDYSKWDRLDLSDDDGDDCHPNIDLASWKRLRGRQRSERREQEDKKIGKYQAKIDKYTAKVEKLKGKLAEDETNVQTQVDLKDAENSKAEYEYKLQKFLSSRKMVADDVCDVKENKALLADDSLFEKPKESEKEPEGKGIYPVSKQKEYDSYDQFQAENRKYLKQFAQMRNDLESQDFLIAHPSLLCDHAEGFLLILTLDTCIKHQLADKDPTVVKTPEEIKQERLKEYTVGKQHLTIHYICELGKSMRRNPLDGVKPFYRKTGPRSEERVEGFEEDLTKFLERIRNRAAEKIANGELASLVEADSSLVTPREVIYEAAGLGPGGLDPNEVLQSLPEDLQSAFVEQDTEKLRKCFEEMPEEEAQYHLQRCVDSGLWVPAVGDDDEEFEEEEAVEEMPEPEQATAANGNDGPIVGDVE